MSPTTEDTAFPASGKQNLTFEHRHVSATFSFMRNSGDGRQCCDSSKPYGEGKLPYL
jgi:hypothetical protein